MSTTTVNTTSEGAVEGDGADGAGARRATAARAGDAAGATIRAGAAELAAAPGTGAGSRRAPVSNPTPSAPDDDHGIDEMRSEIDAIDAELVRLIRRRTELSRTIGQVRASEGGPRIVYSREMRILERFTELGPAGTDLGMLLLSMGRGKLGRR